MGILLMRLTEAEVEVRVMALLHMTPLAA